MIFNSVYSVAVMMLRDGLLEAGIVLRLRRAHPEFWDDRTSESEQGDEYFTPVVDVALVDDECVLLSATSPRVLDQSIDVVLKLLVSIFDILRLEVNWKPGKTECFLRYRGKRSVRRLEARRLGPNGELLVKVPGTTQHITVVPSYKHLGGVVCDDGNLVIDVSCNVRSAMSAFIPIALKVFGSKRISAEVCFSFFWSLVVTRLLFICGTLRYLKT